MSEKTRRFRDLVSLCWIIFHAALTWLTCSINSKCFSWGHHFDSGNAARTYWKFNFHYQFDQFYHKKNFSQNCMGYEVLLLSYFRATTLWGRDPSTCPCYHYFPREIPNAISLKLSWPWCQSVQEKKISPLHGIRPGTFWSDECTSTVHLTVHVRIVKDRETKFPIMFLVVSGAVAWEMELSFKTGRK